MRLIPQLMVPYRPFGGDPYIWDLWFGKSPSLTPVAGALKPFKMGPDASFVECYAKELPFIGFRK